MLPKHIVYCTELKKVLIYSYSVCHDKSDSIMVTVIAKTESGIFGKKFVGDSQSVILRHTCMYAFMYIMKNMRCAHQNQVFRLSCMIFYNTKRKVVNKLCCYTFLTIRFTMLLIVTCTCVTIDDLSEIGSYLP